MGHIQFNYCTATKSLQSYVGHVFRLFDAARSWGAFTHLGGSWYEYVKAAVVVMIFSAETALAHRAAKC